MLSSIKKHGFPIILIVCLLSLSCDNEKGSVQKCESSAQTKHDKTLIKESENPYYPKDFKLIGYRNGEFSENVKIQYPILLTKVNGKCSLRINDCPAEPKDIFEYIGHNQPEYISVFISEHTTFQDLLHLYQWLDYYGIEKVQLITACHAFDEYYVINDDIRLSDSLKCAFVAENKLKLPPPVEGMEEIIPEGVPCFEINESGDIQKLEKVENSEKLLIRVSHQISLKEYFEITELINNKSNFQKEVDK